MYDRSQISSPSDGDWRPEPFGIDIIGVDKQVSIRTSPSSDVTLIREYRSHLPRYFRSCFRMKGAVSIRDAGHARSRFPPERESQPPPAGSARLRKSESAGGGGGGSSVDAKRGSGVGYALVALTLVVSSDWRTGAAPTPCCHSDRGMTRQGERERKGEGRMPSCRQVVPVNGPGRPGGGPINNSLV